MLFIIMTGYQDIIKENCPMLKTPQYPLNGPLEDGGARRDSKK